MKDAWEILGITPTENKRAIKKAYAKMLAKYHPEEYPDEFIEIQNAYQSIMDSLERDYQKPESLSIDFTEGFHKKDTIYLKTPFVEENTRSDFDTELTQQNLFLDLDNEIIHEEKPKQDDESIYDDFDLTWSFQNQDNKLEKEYVKEVYKQEDIEAKQDTEEQNIKEYLYLRFTERIKFSCRTDVLKDLILNQTFFDAIGDEQFYIKISALIRTNYARFDSITKSFLYDAFSYIETNFNYSYTDEKSIRKFIASEKSREEKEKARKQRAEKRNRIILLLCFLLFFFVYMYISRMQRDKEKIEREQIQEAINNVLIDKEDEKEEIKEAMQKNKATLEAYMLETYNGTYTCALYDFLHEPNSVIFFYCDEVQNVENKTNGRVKIGEDYLITEIETFDEIITTEE